MKKDKLSFWIAFLKGAIIGSALVVVVFAILYLCHVIPVVGFIAPLSFWLLLICTRNVLFIVKKVKESKKDD